jgi:hypothetical protein
MKRQVRPREIFLSHATRDRAFATWLAGTLRQHELSVWYSVTHLVGAQQWHREIGAALRRCDWFVVVLTPSSVKSMWVERELTYALSDRRYSSRIVPVLLKPCQHDRLSWTLGGFQFVDFTHGREAGLSALRRIWRLKPPVAS